MVLQTLDGMERIAIDTHGVRMTSASLIKFTAPVIEVAGKITHTGDLEHTGNVEHIGDVDQTGDQTSSGTITGTTDVLAGTISGKTHTHIGSPTAPVGAVSPTGLPI